MGRERGTEGLQANDDSTSIGESRLHQDVEITRCSHHTVGRKGMRANDEEFHARIIQGVQEIQKVLIELRSVSHGESGSIGLVSARECKTEATDRRTPKRPA